MINQLKQKIAELIKADHYPEALEYCGKAFREDPNDEEIQQISLFLFQRMQDAHIEIEPNNAEEYVMRGIARFYAGDVEASVFDYSQAIELDNQFDYAYKCRHFSYATLGKVKESLIDIQKAISLNPTCGMHYFDMANLLSSLPDKKNECLRCYSKAVELESNSELFWNNFGIEL